MIYWDTSCVLKLYTRESDSEQWERLAVSLEEDFASSTLLETEMTCALHRKEQRGEVKTDGAETILGLFRNDVQAGRFTLCPIGADVLSHAGTLAAQCYRHAEPVNIRTLDALHLATATLLKCRAIATADERMQAAAQLLGFKTI